MRRALLLAFLSCWAGAAHATEGGIEVELDHARILRMNDAAQTVIVGNPAIADVAIHDSKTLVLTGRSFGSTNVVVLGQDGAVILDDDVVVSGAETGTLRIYRQAMRTTYSCTPKCQPTVAVGDEDTHFSAAISQFSAREGMVGGGQP